MKMSWFLLAISALVLFAGLVLVQKHLLNLGINPIVWGFYLMGLTFIGFLITSIMTKQKLTIPSAWWIFLILAAVITLLANIASTYSFQSAPNPAYTQAIISASGILVLFISIFLFKSEITLIKSIGVILITIGVILLGINK